ncbi:CYTH domain-containing protein, partial [uncultured Bilophila sp.]
VEEADLMLDTLAQRPLIQKRRYAVPYKGFVWEVDEFFEENAGLIVAEIELSYEAQPFEKPEWIGEEVTGDRRYSNASLSVLPFSRW